jgi:hypothetical protein
MKDVITIRPMGGVGNYMFQIATAYSYSKKFSKDLVVNFDDAIKVHQSIKSYLDNVFFNVFKFASSEKRTYSVLKENGFHYTELPYLKGNVLLDGYYQSEKYFREFDKDIKTLFSFPQSIVGSVKEKYKFPLSKESCSIHVRRGDYVGQPQNHPTQGIGYYMKAAKKVGVDKIFLVFSDDIQWCKDNFPEMDNFIFIEGNKDYEDLFLMSKCTHNIICNSSFSWWAAWLNENPNKVVVAPKMWFGSAYAHFDTKDLYCENWIVI